jgi:hypothetical protein
MSQRGLCQLSKSVATNQAASCGEKMGGGGVKEKKEKNFFLERKELPMVAKTKKQRKSG